MNTGNIQGLVLLFNIHLREPKTGFEKDLTQDDNVNGAVTEALALNTEAKQHRDICFFQTKAKCHSKKLSRPERGKNAWKGMIKAPNILLNHFIRSFKERWVMVTLLDVIFPSTYCFKSSPSCAIRDSRCYENHCYARRERTMQLKNISIYRAEPDCLYGRPPNNSIS